MLRATTPLVARRPARDDDGSFLFELFSAVQGGLLEGLPVELRATLLRHQFAGQDVTYRTAHPDARFEVLEVDGAPVGRVVSAVVDGALVVVDLALSPAWQGRGIGGSILRGFQEQAREAGRQLRVAVTHSNDGSRRLNERLGFVACGATETHLHMQWTP